jgi:hypothetical protein
LFTPAGTYIRTPDVTGESMTTVPAYFWPGPSGSEVNPLGPRQVDACPWTSLTVSPSGPMTEKSAAVKVVYWSAA